MNDFHHNRATTRFSVGEYWLVPEADSMMFRAISKTSKAVPPCLRGRWTGTEAFRRACEKVHGSDAGYDRRSLNRRGELAPEEMDRATTEQVKAALAEASVV